MTSHPELFWGLIVSMWIGNLMLVAGTGKELYFGNQPRKQDQVQGK